MNTTDPTCKRPYNITGPSGYLLTFHTYGTWFHGDIRGSVGRNGNNIPGTPVLAPNQQRVNFEMKRSKHVGVTFDKMQQTSIHDTIKSVATFSKWLLHAVNVRTEHVHVVLSATKSPDIIMNSLKSWCTRKMNENGLWNKDFSPWSRHGSTRYLWDEKSVYDAVNYVLYCQD
jgi:REP element-mobilizing transposase RayT